MPLTKVGSSPVILAPAMTRLESLRDIPSARFWESAYLGLGNKKEGVLYCFSPGGRLTGSLMTGPLQLTSSVPDVDLKRDYGTGSDLVPFITFIFSDQKCEMPECYSYGSLPLREMALSAIVEAGWGVTFVPQQGPRRYAVPPGFPPPITSSRNPGRPAGPLSYPTSKKGVVPITRRRASMQNVRSLSVEARDQAFAQALGRNPVDGDRLVFTCGIDFSRGVCLMDRLYVSDQLSLSLMERDYPRVWIERTNGVWRVASNFVKEYRDKRLLDGILDIRAWEIVLPPNGHVRQASK